MISSNICLRLSVMTMTNELWKVKTEVNEKLLVNIGFFFRNENLITYSQAMWITQHIKDAFFGDHHRHFHLFDRNSLSCCSCLWYYFYFYYYYYYCGLSHSQEAQNRNQDWLCGDNNQRPHTRFFEARNVTHLSPSAERVNVDDRRRRLLRRLGSCCRDAIDSHACAHSFFSFYVSFLSTFVPLFIWF